MAAWTLVPCLVTLRGEFNSVAPGRDKGADGAVGDSSHTSASDHTPDEDSNVLRDHDADSKNEVHALDIDSSGPWPGSVTDFSAFNLMVRDLVAREKAEYESPTIVGRLKYVIWNRQIASRSWGWTWRPHTGADPHTNHAHFSARYESGPESDTRPWGVAEEDDMPTAEEIAKAVWAHKLVDGYDPTVTKSAGAYQRYSPSKADVRAISAQVAALAGKDMVDEQALVDLFTQALTAALPPGQAVTKELMQAAILGALQELADRPPA